MKFLNPPIPEITPEDIFECCVQNYTDSDRKKRLLACKHLVEVDSANYQKLVPNQIDELESFTGCMVNARKRKLWLDAIEVLKSDPTFDEVHIESLVENMPGCVSDS